MDKNGVWQLLRLTLRYCPHNSSSKKMREFIRTSQPPPSSTLSQSPRTLKNFAEKNPQLEIVARVLKNRHPVVIAEYKSTMEGKRVFDPDNFKHLVPEKHPVEPHVVDVKNKSTKEIYDVLHMLRNTSGRRMNEKIKKQIFTEAESIQGAWQPGITKGTTFTIKHL